MILTVVVLTDIKTRKVRILRYLAMDLAVKGKALNDSYDILKKTYSIHEIKIFVSYLKTQMNRQKILKKEIDNYKLNLKN